ncbi:zinc finger protein 724-like [Procambarus clarkii]|uniref:zinc finger protein 724-like n=1 Tax=Procambarus clarkii TaxID=6728 RepID=UPI0037421CDC
MSTSYKDYEDVIDIFTQLDNLSKESDVSVTTNPLHEETEEQGGRMLRYIGETSAVCPKESGQEFTLLKPVEDTGEKLEDSSSVTTYPLHEETEEQCTSMLRHIGETSEVCPKESGQEFTLLKPVEDTGEKLEDSSSVTTYPLHEETEEQGGRMLRYIGETSAVCPKESGQEFTLLKPVEDTGEKLEDSSSVTTYPLHEETEEQCTSMLRHIGETSEVCPKESGQEFTLLKPVEDSGEKLEVSPKYGEGSTVLRRRRAVHSGEKSEECLKYGEGSTVLRKRRAVQSGEKSEVSPKYGEGSPIPKKRRAVHSGEKFEVSPRYGEGSPLLRRRRAVRSGVKPTLCDRYPGEKSEVFPKSGQEFPLLKTEEQGRLGHTGEKLEACPESGERSTLPKKQMVADRPSCYLCEKTFSDRSGLNKHMLVHIGVKSHVCAECGKKFLRNDYLQQHLMAHTGDKQFLCKHCGKRFCRLGNFNDHMMGHNGTRPHMCHVCDKLFSRPDYLKVHMVVHMI